jgi:hypothetical protein
MIVPARKDFFNNKTVCDTLGFGLQQGCLCYQKICAATRLFATKGFVLQQGSLCHHSIIVAPRLFVLPEQLCSNKTVCGTKSVMQQDRLCYQNCDATRLFLLPKHFCCQKCSCYHNIYAEIQAVGPFQIFVLQYDSSWFQRIGAATRLFGLP